ncbi:hypothetical protein V8F06_001676 [Rhypophila decipiens]
MQKVSKRYCAETGAGYEETLERLCWVSLECGAWEDEGTEILDSPMSFAALGEHVDILLLLQEHQVEYRDYHSDPPRKMSGSGGNPYKATFEWEGKADPGAIVNAAYKGNLELLRLAIWPPSRSDQENTNSYLGQMFGCADRRSNAYRCLMVAKHMTGNWEVYRFLAAFLGHYDKVLELEHFDSHLKNTYMAGRELASRLEEDYARQMVDNNRRLENVNLKGTDDLWYHQHYGHVDIVRGFFDDGLDPNSLTFSLEGIDYDPEDMLDLLIERGISIDRSRYINGHGYTFVFTNALSGRFGMVKKLVQVCENLNELDLEKTLSAAMSQEHPAMEMFLLQPHVLARFGVLDLEAAEKIRSRAAFEAAEDLEYQAGFPFAEDPSFPR